MASAPEKPQVPGGGAGETNANIAGELQKEITQTIANLIIKAQELGFELATCECPHANSCEVVKKAREVVREIKRLVAIQRRLVTR